MPRPDEREGAEVNVASEEIGLVKVILDDTEELTVTDWPVYSMAEKGYGSREVVRLVSQQLGPPRPCPAAPAQHQLLLLDSQRLTSPKPSN